MKNYPPPCKSAPETVVWKRTLPEKALPCASSWCSWHRGRRFSVMVPSGSLTHLVSARSGLSLTSCTWWTTLALRYLPRLAHSAHSQ